MQAGRTTGGMRRRAEGWRGLDRLSLGRFAYHRSYFRDHRQQDDPKSAVELEFFSHRWERLWWRGCPHPEVHPECPAHPDDARGSKARALAKYGREAAWHKEHGGQALEKFFCQCLPGSVSRSLCVLQGR